MTSSPRQLGRHAFRRAARDVEVDCATCMIWRRQHRHRQRRACARTGLRRELLPTNNSDRQEDVASGRRVRKTATAALSLTSAIGWHRVCSTLMLVSVSHCAQSQVQDAPGLIGAWVRVHPHDAPLEREGVRRNNAKNESCLLPKFQNDECLSSMCVRRWQRRESRVRDCGSLPARGAGVGKEVGGGCFVLGCVPVIVGLRLLRWSPISSHGHVRFFE